MIGADCPLPLGAVLVLVVVVSVVFIPVGKSRTSDKWLVVEPICANVVQPLFDLGVTPRGDQSDLLRFTLLLPLPWSHGTFMPL